MHKIIIGRQADRKIKKLPPEYFRLVRQHIKSLADNPRPFGAEKLTNAEGYKLRVGVYRVLYTIDDKRPNHHCLPRQASPRGLPTSVKPVPHHQKDPQGLRDLEGLYIGDSLLKNRNSPNDISHNDIYMRQ